ncbi:MAG: transcriptional regulator PpsR [Henriciella sp.]|uniref:transcriptional regulator PpsR n=1 Tax=Henriciella sp. TaxID=1968823 RepID=UPI003C74A12E
MDAKSSHIPPSKKTRSGFQSPGEHFVGLSADKVADLIGAATDIALIVEDGIVKDVALADKTLISNGYGDAWLGKAWIDTVTVESRPKIEALLNGETSDMGWRQVNHISKSSLDVPVKYTTVPVDGKDRFIALGRDLSDLSQLQQKLINAHQDLERDYSRMRMAEGRYRLLFNTSSEAILVVNAQDWTIEEANSAAETLTDHIRLNLVGQPISSLFKSASTGRLNTLIASAASQGMSSDTDLTLSSGRQVELSASAFTENDQKRVILRLSDNRIQPSGDRATRTLDKMVDHLPDGLVIADADQRILMINGTFAQMSQLASTQEATGTPLKTYLGRSSTDINVLYSTLKKNGIVRNFATVSRDRFGSEEKVEISAVTAPTQTGTLYAFSVRSVSRRLAPSPGLDEQLPSSTTELTELVGRVPLKEIVNESSVLIERLCIEAALKISDNNRASAAEMLGLSRQGLYSKLKRVGLDASD